MFVPWEHGPAAITAVLHSLLSLRPQPPAQWASCRVSSIHYNIPPFPHPPLWPAAQTSCSHRTATPDPPWPHSTVRARPAAGLFAANPHSSSPTCRSASPYTTAFRTASTRPPGACCAAALRGAPTT